MEEKKIYPRETHLNLPQLTYNITTLIFMDKSFEFKIDIAERSFFSCEGVENFKHMYFRIVTKDETLLIFSCGLRQKHETNWNALKRTESH